MTTEPTPLTCSECRRGIDCCCFCDEEDCQVAVCYPCLMTALRLAVHQPHAHGG
jgi:hypothetical protein